MSNFTKWIQAAGGISEFSRGLWFIFGFLAALVLVAVIFAILAVLGARGIGPLKKRSVPEKSLVTGPIVVGKVHEQGARKNQQDSFFVSADSADDNLLAVVADGMGGLKDSDRVSQTAVSTIARSFFEVQENDPEVLLLKLVGEANTAVNKLLGYNGLYQSGTTMLTGLIRDHNFYYLSIGDSRISLFRDGMLYQLNRDHVFRNELYIDAVNGKRRYSEAASHPKASGLTSFIGMGELKYIDIPSEPVEVKPGDCFVLMSDGVYNALSDEEIIEALKEGPDVSAQLLKTAVAAKNYQNQDNYTAVILNC